MNEMMKQQYYRIIKAFAQDETACSFLREDGEGGFAIGIYRMAREIEWLREKNSLLAQAEQKQNGEG